MNSSQSAEDSRYEVNIMESDPESALVTIKCFAKSNSMHYYVLMIEL